MVGMPQFGNAIKELLRGLANKAFPSNFRQSLYYIHPDEKLFIYDFRHDLTGAGVPSDGTGLFTIMQWKAPKDQIWIIKGFAPYAMERTDAGGVTESARYIDPKDGNGWFSFTPLMAEGAPFLIQTNYNKPQNIGAPADDKLRQVSNGISQISLTPYVDALNQMRNPFFSMPVKSDQTFKTIFSLMAPPATIANPYFVGNPTAPATKRVDFAGVVVAGVSLNENAYNEAAALFQKGGY